MPRIHVGDWVEDLVDWMQTHLTWLFDFISDVVGGAVGNLEDALNAPPVLVIALLFGVIGWAARSALFGVLAFVGFAFIEMLDQWDAAMSTLSLVLISSFVALVIAVPLGVWAARSQRVSSVMKPVLDFMQTMPAFVYLIPAITFFGIGEVPGVISTVIFALPPGVRMTELGIRNVDKEMVEAGEAFGTSEWNILRNIQFPLALPSVMAGVNQVIMLSLSMVVTAGIVGAGGLGAEVYGALTQGNVGIGFEAGLAVVVLAVFLDRAVGALGQQVEVGARRKMKEKASGSVIGALNWRPPVVATVSGVAILAVAATLLGGSLAAKDSSGKKTVTIGWIPWEEDVAVTYMYKNLLEQRGYNVELKQLDVAPTFQALAQGDIDLFMDAWLPDLHKNYMEKYKNDIEEISQWYKNVDLQIAVPKNLPYNTVEDLKGHASEFGGRIVGIEPGANLMKLTEEKLIPDYGLDGFKVQTSSTPAMIAELDRAMSKGEPIAVTMWRPHWAYSKYDIKPLADPKKSYGEAGYISALGRKGFAKDFPELNGFVKQLSLDDSIIGPLEQKIYVDFKGKPNAEEEGVKAYLKEHPEAADKFVPGFTSGEQKPAAAAAGPGVLPPAREPEAVS